MIRGSLLGLFHHCVFESKFVWESQITVRSVNFAHSDYSSQSFPGRHTIHSSKRTQISGKSGCLLDTVISTCHMIFPRCIQKYTVAKKKRSLSLHSWHAKSSVELWAKKTTNLCLKDRLSLGIKWPSGVFSCPGVNMSKASSSTFIIGVKKTSCFKFQNRFICPFAQSYVQCVFYMIKQLCIKEYAK